TKENQFVSRQSENMPSSFSTLPRADKTSDSTKSSGIDKFRASPQRDPISGRGRSYAVVVAPSPNAGASHTPRPLPSQMKSEKLTFSATYRRRKAACPPMRMSFRMGILMFGRRGSM
ncbi:hypothetical protein K438DRAFT_1801543, partial [Mycena galopus ATCC 62051]